MFIPEELIVVVNSLFTNEWKTFYMKQLTIQSTMKAATRATHEYLANTKHYAKERIRKSNNVNDDDDEEKLDHTNFQEIFCNITDDLVEEDDNN